MSGPVHEPERELLICAAALLEQGRTADRFSRPLTIAALLVTLLGPAMVPALAWPLAVTGLLTAAAGAVQLYLAIRVGFDAALFRQLAARPTLMDVSGMDRALGALALLPPDRQERPVAARIAGARRLFRWQLRALVLQVCVLLAGAAWVWGDR
jgi:hypothetical protein